MEFAAAALEAIGTTAVEVGASAAATGGEVAAAGSEVAAASAEAASVALPAAGKAAAEGGSLFSSLGTASTVTSILSGTATIASILNTVQAGDTKSQALEMEAKDAETQVGQQVTAGLQARQSLRAQLVQTLGSQTVAAGASGVDTSFGSPEQARRQAAMDSERALSVSENTTTSNVQALYERSAALRQAANAARKGAMGAAAAQALEGAAKVVRRG